MLDLDFQTPLIFDESFDFSEPEESRFVGAFSDGLLAKSGGLFSMSAYEKSPQADFLDYDATRALHDTAGFSAYAQPPYVTHLFPSALESHTIPDDESVHYVTNEGYPGANSFDLPRSPVLDLGSRQLPEVASYAPLTGHEGSKLSVYLQSPYDLLSPAAPTSFSLLFGSERCECIVTSLGLHKSNFQYVLSVDVPPFAATACPSLTVPIQMIMDESEGQGAQAVHVGVFTYDHNPQSAVSPAGTSRKRRLSESSDETSRSTRSAPVKQLRIKEPANTFTYSESLSGSPYSPYLPTPTTANVYPVQYHPASPRPSIPQYTGTSGVSQPMIKAPSPLAASWSPSFSTVNISAHSPGLSMTPNSHSSSMPSPVKSMNPTLIRTSTIQHLAGAGGPNQAFNPYAMYPSKAVLKVNGDLDSMTENWSPEERNSKRRLVHFTRRQTGSTIHADFKSVSPADRVPNSICISCIYWEGKKECYVTSVDTIYLLESLVGVRFTVEEKNRIRRNLEGFRPLTVSKAKPESEDFFKVIMGFPNPKPRNIEKDVKVFPWKILSHALKKIIGKYSASYSSTAGTLATHISPNYVSTPDGSADLHATSPSISDTGAAAAYAANVSASGISPHLRGPKQVLDNAPVSGSVDLRLMVTSNSNNNNRHYSNLPAPYPYQNINHPQPQAAPTAAGNRGSWDFGAFVNASSGTTTGPTHSLSYPRQNHLGNVSQDYNTQPVYPLGHPTTGP
ncbi:transcriptional regulator medusa [Histoplasma capsulatum G186AR]|uniref:Transcriptional regulator medusa n=2 Tax=Ajellomyces capsulatus TaxID=5037 RepID=C0NSJ3_AJECG|nr:transcriptional regulator medusa [Histoplasma capsulatum G186AR]EEH05859.1 transcriptional regulator medusa [Histoplasma capsulatum G186AR]